VWQLRGAVRNEPRTAGAEGPRMTAAAPRRAHVSARFDATSAATLDELAPLRYTLPREGLPAYARAASALRRFENRLVVVQDDVNALAIVQKESGSVRAVLLPEHASGKRVFDDTLGNKHEKLDLEACVTLEDGRFVAFGSGSTPAREQLAVWSGREPPVVVAAPAFYRELRAAVAKDGGRLNVEGAVVCGERLRLFHRANDVRGAGRSPLNAVADVDANEFARWLDGGASVPRVASVTTAGLGDTRGVPFGFTDAVALDADRVVVLACAEDTDSAITDGAVLGCRVGLLDENGLTMVDVHDAAGRPSLLKLEGIERRPSSSTEFDVAVDVDRTSVPAMLGRLVWDWR
jgi:hypothetical protein